MPVIAMTREMGSLGKDVAEGLAKELGLKFIYHEIVDSLAEKMHMPQSAVLRFLQGKTNLLERLRVDMNELSRYTAEEVFDLAIEGNLMIRGWGGNAPVAPCVECRLCQGRCPDRTAGETHYGADGDRRSGRRPGRSESQRCGACRCHATPFWG